jgi:hypothetical protein
MVFFTGASFGRQFSVALPRQLKFSSAGTMIAGSWEGLGEKRTSSNEA